MKIKDKYQELKIGNPDYLVLIKSGNFYLTIEDDAYMMNLLFDYKIIKGKVGFPLNALERVMGELEKESVNYVIFKDEDDIITKKFDDNEYISLIGESKKREYKSSMKKLLLERIEFLIDNSEDNYDKIRRFIDEL